MKFGDAVIYNIGGVDHNALVQVVNQDGSLHLAYFAPERENPVASKRIGYLPAIIYDYDVPEAKVSGWRIPVAHVEYYPKVEDAIAQLPSAEDLDKVAEEQKAADLTAAPAAPPLHEVPQNDPND